MVSESFPFDKLPVELQLLVWQYAIADLAPVMAGDLNLSTTTLCLRGRSIDYAKDYFRLLSTCHLSRYEIFRNPPVFMVEAPDIPYFSNDGNYLVRPEDLVDLVTRIGAYLPRLEYVSLVCGPCLAQSAKLMSSGVMDMCMD